MCAYLIGIFATVLPSVLAFPSIVSTVTRHLSWHFLTACRPSMVRYVQFCGWQKQRVVSLHRQNLASGVGILHVRERHLDLDV